MRSISRSTSNLFNALRLGRRPQPRSNFHATRIPVPARTAQAWLRRFNSAFASCPGCKHCSDAAVS